MAHRVLETRAGVDPELYSAVLRLQAACERADGSDLKLELSAQRTDASPDTLLLREEGRVIGYCGLDAGVDVEIFGMVHPDSRRLGLGTRLLDGALSIARGSGCASALIICEDAFPAAMASLERRGAELDSSEHRMVASLDAPIPDAPVAHLRRAEARDAAPLTRILSDGFPHAATFVERILDAQRESALEETVVLDHDETVMATARVVLGPRRAMIYGFVVDATLRGRGHGRAMLRGVMQRVRARGATEVGLEVDTQNTAALRLYRTFGFRTITTYRYMRLPT